MNAPQYVTLHLRQYQYPSNFYPIKSFRFQRLHPSFHNIHCNPYYKVKAALGFKYGNKAPSLEAIWRNGGIDPPFLT
jgi:hypothetical protein